MDPLSLGLTIGGALFGGISNLLGASEEEKQYQRRKEQANKILERNLISEGELSLMLNNTERLFNSRLTSTLNSTALRSRGVANANVVGGAVAGAMEGEKLQAQAQQRGQVMAANIQTNTQIAQNNMNTPVVNKTAAFVSGTLGGAQMGMAAGSLINTLGNLDSIGLRTGAESEMSANNTSLNQNLSNYADSGMEDISIEDSIANKFGPSAEFLGDNPSALQTILNADLDGKKKQSNQSKYNQGPSQVNWADYLRPVDPRAPMQNPFGQPIQQNYSNSQYRFKVRQNNFGFGGF